MDIGRARKLKWELNFYSMDKWIAHDDLPWGDRKWCRPGEAREGKGFRLGARVLSPCGLHISSLKPVFLPVRNKSSVEVVHVKKTNSR
jgi:hypothetical protein